MVESYSFIGDKGVIKKTDRFGLVVIVVCGIISAFLVALGIAAIMWV